MSLKLSNSHTSNHKQMYAEMFISCLNMQPMAVDTHMEV